MLLPEALSNAIDALGRLPGVGTRTAERYAYYLLKSNPANAEQIADTLSSLHKNIATCPISFALMNAGQEYSELYTDPKRDKKTVLVVEEALDIYAIERTKAYTGTYHILGGVISPMDDISPAELHIKELIQRVKTDAVSEVIIATNPSVEGESTAILLEQLLHEKYPNLHITRLARGLPLGISLEYADQITLASALDNRTKL